MNVIPSDLAESTFPSPSPCLIAVPKSMLAFLCVTQICTKVHHMKLFSQSPRKTQALSFYQNGVLMLLQEKVTSWPKGRLKCIFLPSSIEGLLLHLKC